MDFNRTFDDPFSDRVFWHIQRDCPDRKFWLDYHNTSKRVLKTLCLRVSVAELRIPNPSHNMEIEIARDKVTHRVIHDLSISGIDLGNKLKQHIPALDFQCLGNFGGGVGCADGGTRDP